jgi:lipopolysaccharide biosynthesis protein
MSTSTWVLIHAYYAKELSKILDHIKHVPQPNLIVATVPQCGNVSRITNQIEASGGTIILCKNLGFDIGGLIQAINSCDFNDNDIILKIHTKKDKETTESNARCIVKRASEVIELFNNDCNLGMVGTAGRLVFLSSPESIGANRAKYEEAAERLGIPKGRLYHPFFAGTIFWIRGAILNHIKKCNYAIEEFEPPQIDHDFDPKEEFNAPAEYAVPSWINKNDYQFFEGAVYNKTTRIAFDGHKAHAFERIFCSLTAHLGYKYLAI